MITLPSSSPVVSGSRASWADPNRKAVVIQMFILADLLMFIPLVCEHLMCQAPGYILQLSHLIQCSQQTQEEVYPHFTAWETKAQSHKISTQGGQCIWRGLRFNSFNNSCDKAHKSEPAFDPWTCLLVIQLRPIPGPTCGGLLQGILLPFQLTYLNNLR